MKICVLVKERPRGGGDEAHQPLTGRLERGGETRDNPFDTHAIEAAMQLKEGGELRSTRSSR